MAEFDPLTGCHKIDVRAAVVRMRYRGCNNVEMSCEAQANGPKILMVDQALCGVKLSFDIEERGESDSRIGLMYVKLTINEAEALALAIERTVRLHRLNEEMKQPPQPAGSDIDRKPEGSQAHGN